MIYYEPYTARLCGTCDKWLPDSDEVAFVHFAAHHPEELRGGKDSLVPPFMGHNEFEVSDRNPHGRTPCCGSFLTGTDQGLACKGCYTLYDGMGYVGEVFAS